MALTPDHMRDALRIMLAYTHFAEDHTDQHDWDIYHVCREVYDRGANYNYRVMNALVYLLHESEVDGNALIDADYLMEKLLVNDVEEIEQDTLRQIEAEEIEVLKTYEQEMIGSVGYKHPRRW